MSNASDPRYDHTLIKLYKCNFQSHSSISPQLSHRVHKGVTRRCLHRKFRFWLLLEFQAFANSLCLVRKNAIEFIYRRFNESSFVIYEFVKNEWNFLVPFILDAHLRIWSRWIGRDELFGETFNIIMFVRMKGNELIKRFSKRSLGELPYKLVFLKRKN